MLRYAVEKSRLLSDAERQYWLRNLPKMNKEQLQKLEGILSEAEGLPWDDAMQHYLSIATKATMTL